MNVVERLPKAEQFTHYYPTGQLQSFPVESMFDCYAGDVYAQLDYILAPQCLAEASNALPIIIKDGEIDARHIFAHAHNLSLFKVCLAVQPTGRASVLRKWA